MPFYEVIYEPGTHSVAFYESDDEALAAVGAQHSKATSGEAGGPTGHRAERVVKVLKYDKHPAELNLTQTMSATEVTKAVEEAVKKIAVGGEVSLPELASHVRDMSSPLVLSGPHESNYVAKESEQLTLPWDGDA